MHRFLSFLLSVSVCCDILVFAELTKYDCFSKFRTIRFRARAFDRYDKMFTADAMLRLPQAGVFRGLNEMEEYVRFLSRDNPYLSSFFTFVGSFVLKSIDGDICTFRTTSYFQVMADQKFNPTKTVMEFNAVFLAYFDARVSRVKQFDVFFPDGAFYYLFMDPGYLSLHSPFKHKFCSLILTNCADVCAANNITTPQQCLAAYEPVGHRLQSSGWDLSTALSKANENPLDTFMYIDADESGCKTLHSVMTSFNPGHCPHTSLAPMLDALGRTKCQDMYLYPQKRVNASFLFEEEDFIEVVSDAKYWGLTQHDPTHPTEKKFYLARLKPRRPAWVINLFLTVSMVPFFLYGVLIIVDYRKQKRSQSTKNTPPPDVHL